MKIKNNPSKNTNTWTKRALVGASFAVPAVYISQKHVDMYAKDDKISRNRIRNKMVGFFAGVAVSVGLTHYKINSKKVSAIQQAGLLLGAVAAPFAGLFAAKQINKEFYLKK